MTLLYAKIAKMVILKVPNGLSFMTMSRFSREWRSAVSRGIGVHRAGRFRQ